MAVSLAGLAAAAALLGRGAGSSGASSTSTSPIPPPTSSERAETERPSLLKLPYTSWSDGQHQALERRVADYLQAFEGVEAADVLISRPADTPFAAEQRPVTAVARLTLAPAARLSADQLLALARSMVARVPDLDLTNITITDAAAQVVFEAGVARSEGAAGPPVQVTSPGRDQSPSEGFAPAELALAGGIGLSLGLLIAALAWAGRRASATPSAEVSADEEAFAFLAELPARDAARLLADERPSLLAAALPAMPARTQRRVLRSLEPGQRRALARMMSGADGSAGAGGTSASPEALRAAGAALQAKLARSRRRAGAMQALLAAAPASERRALPPRDEGVMPWRE
ncbi:MAG: hypothetical protein ACE5R4_01115 [Armatimonadota bacterium]